MIFDILNDFIFILILYGEQFSLNLLQSNLVQSSSISSSSSYSLMTYLQFVPDSFVPDSFVLISISIVSGVLVGFSLGLIGGGGSILAVPLLVYFIGLNPHMAIGTSAFAVGVNALINFFDHKSKGHVHLKKAIIFAIPGTLGTLIGSQLGLLTPPDSLLLLFAVFMIVVAAKTLKGKKGRKIKDLSNNNNLENTNISSSSDFLKEPDLVNNNEVDKNDQPVIPVKSNNYRLSIIGFLVGISAGYFGIGGGFIIVPSLMHFNLNIVDAIGTSLLPVSSFGLATAARYSISNQIDWIISLLFIVGGIMGGKIGTFVSSRTPKDILTKMFSILLIIVAVSIILDSVLKIFH